MPKDVRQDATRVIFEAKDAIAEGFWKRSSRKNDDYSARDSLLMTNTNIDD